MDTPITRAEHEEFRKRIEEENNRQNRRLELVEDNMRQLFCPKCKRESLIQVEKFQITVIKEPDALTQSR